MNRSMYDDYIIPHDFGQVAIAYFRLHAADFVTLIHFRLKEAVIFLVCFRAFSAFRGNSGKDPAAWDFYRILYNSGSLQAQYAGSFRPLFHTFRVNSLSKEILHKYHTAS